MRRCWTMMLTLCALFGLVAAAPVHAGDKVHTVGKEALKIEGSVADNDPKVKVTEPNVNVSVDLPAKTYQVKLQAGAKYRIEILGPSIDPVLAIQDGTGKQIGFDDDGGEGLNSRLDFTAPADATYKFICASLKGAGAFTLTVTLTSGGDGKAVVGAPGKDMSFEGNVAASDPTVKVANREFHTKVHEVKLAGGKKYVIDLKKKDGSIDPLLIIQDKSGKILGVDDDGGGFPHSRLSFNCPKDDTYKLFAAALDGEGGYALTIKQVALSADEAKIHEVGAGGLKVNGKLDKEVRSITYQVKMEAGKTYVIDLISPDQKALDPLLKLLDANGKQLALDDDGGGGLNSRITFQATAAGTYRIVALPLFGAGDFILEVKEQ